jgi:hypothetical protein
MTLEEEAINDRCSMCLSRNICTSKIRAKCAGRFILDRGLSAYYHQEVIK